MSNRRQIVDKMYSVAQFKLGSTIFFFVGIILILAAFFALSAGPSALWGSLMLFGFLLLVVGLPGTIWLAFTDKRS
jgi:FtsH-binding integral membrane protein